MTFVIVSAEIDLSVASAMGLAAVLVAWLPGMGVPFEVGIVIALAVGALCGLFNGYWIAIVGLPSLAVTLATLIGFRGLARLLIEDRSVGGFPDWFNRLGQEPILGPFPLAILIFVGLVVVSMIVLGHSGFGRYVYVVGSSARVARFSGVRVERIRLVIFTMSGFIAALAGILLAARLGAVRGSTAEGFELDIITMVLLGGVSIFGGKGSMTGVILSILLILNLRNGLGPRERDREHPDRRRRAVADPVGAAAEPRVGRAPPIPSRRGRRCDGSVRRRIELRRSGRATRIAFPVRSGGFGPASGGLAPSWPGFGGGHGMRSKYSTSLTLLAAIVFVTGCSSSSGGSPSAAASVAASAAAPSVAASAAATSAAPSASTEASASASSSASASASASGVGLGSGGPAVKATPGQSVKMMLLPKFLGILPFDQANKGATEAATELKNPEKLSFVGPTAENSVAGPDRVHDQRPDPGDEGRDDVEQRR